MAPAVRAEVALVSLKNCLVNLPPGLIALISNTNIVSTTLHKKTSVLTSNPASPKHRGRIAISVTNALNRRRLKRQLLWIPAICLCRMDWNAQPDSPVLRYQQ